MSQGEKWAVAVVFAAVFALTILLFSAIDDDDSKPSRIPGLPVPTAISCDPSCP